MIERYTLKKMADIWTEKNRFQTWLDIEVAICEAYAQLGLIPADDMKVIREKAAFDAKRVLEIEQVTKHDVVAFVNCVSEFVCPASKWLHMGVTSSDILDTSFSMLLKQAADILVEDISALMEVLKAKAFQYKMTPMIGRTHGIHAEPITFGLTMTHFCDEMRRNHERMTVAREAIRYGKISGAVGTYAHVPPAVETYVCKKVGLKPAPISTQIIPRDYYSEFFTTVAMVGTSAEKLALEIRHLQRTEVGEAEEFFSKGQTGSSSMPHKRNPVLTENLTGLARLVRGYAVPAMENVALWHERDISHSSVERMIGPDATITLDFALARLANVVDQLVVYPKNMKKNLDRLGGLIHSQRVLLALTQKGVSRERAYELVQRNAMPVWRGEGEFLTFLKADREVAKALRSKELEALFDIGYHLKHVDTIFRRVFGE